VVIVDAAAGATLQSLAIGGRAVIDIGGKRQPAGSGAGAA
jgi:hypothetical protein